MPPTLAVLIPCHNEASAITSVIGGFRRALPMADIYVYDNNSTDCTVPLARLAGARVFSESMQGKGNVVRRMFSDVEADVYILVDGDDTYDPNSAWPMVLQLLNERLDMMTGTRVTEIVAAYRRGHRLGNFILSGLVRHAFGSRISDMLSGYRVLNRRFVKSFPALSSGFEIETELTIHALGLGMPVGERTTPYKDRPQGGASKLRTYSDGWRILRTIVFLIKEEQPLAFFSVIGLALLLTGLFLSIPIFLEFHRTHLVPRFPTAILSVSLVIMAFLSLACGLILDSVARGRKEIKRMIYMATPAWQGQLHEDTPVDGLLQPEEAVALP